MRRLKQNIAARQDELRKHRLFEVIETSRSAAPLARMARALAWWPMVFQDVLRLNLERIEGAAARRWAEHHRVEDAGHDRWFLDDLRAFAVEAPGLDELFGDGFRPIRDACYALVGEACREQSDTERIALLLALESTGHVFFTQVAAAVERLCPDLPLRYFAQFHLGVELDHELFAESTDLEHIVLSDAERRACLGARCERRRLARMAPRGARERQSRIVSKSSFSVMKTERRRCSGARRTGSPAAGRLQSFQKDKQPKIGDVHEHFEDCQLF